MKTRMLIPLATVLAFVAAASSAAEPPRKPMRPISECLVARQVLDWGVVDDRRLVVKSLGNRYYDIQLKHSCTDLVRRPYIIFRDGLRGTPTRGFGSGAGGDPLSSDGRICGDLGDSVIPVSGYRDGWELTCRIDRIRRIDRTTFDGVFNKDSEAANAFLDAAPTLQPVARAR